MYKEMNFMSDRRPPQRSASSAARRPASSGSRPAGSRPSGGSGSRRPAPRRGRRTSGRFYAFIVILIVVIIAVALLIWQPWASNSPDVQNDSPQAAQETVAPAANTETGAADPAADAAADANATTDPTALSALLGSEDTDIAGLSDEQLVDVTDLSINPDLPSEWVNILLLGVDQRNQNESCRSDTMIICSINTQTSEVKLSSLMRDIAVEYDDLGANNGTYRLNAANYFGGPALAMKTINELLDLNIQNYVMVNFTGFTQIVEALGGIEMDITEEEMNQINHNAMSQYAIAQQYGWDESNLESTNVLLEEYGENVHLNGRQALAYARIRKIDSDWERTNRQRKVLVALMDKMRGTNAMELMQLGMTLQQYIETNMQLNDIISIAERVLNSDLESVDTMVLPLTGTYVQETRNEQSMFYDVDWTTNTRELQNFIYY